MPLRATATSEAGKYSPKSFLPSNVLSNLCRAKVPRNRLFPKLLIFAAPIRAARVSERFGDSTNSCGHGASGRSPARRLLCFQEFAPDFLEVSTRHSLLRALQLEVDSESELHGSRRAAPAFLAKRRRAGEA